MQNIYITTMLVKSLATLHHFTYKWSLSSPPLPHPRYNTMSFIHPTLRQYITTLLWGRGLGKLNNDFSLHKNLQLSGILFADEHFSSTITEDYTVLKSWTEINFFFTEKLFRNTFPLPNFSLLAVIQIIHISLVMVTFFCFYSGLQLLAFTRKDSKF